MREMNHSYILKSRPAGEPAEANFEIVEAPVAEPSDGQVLCKTLFLSLDPYMRGLMNAGRSYVQGVEVGSVMAGEAISRVIASRHADFKEGDVVLGHSSWQEYAVMPAQSLRKLAPIPYPMSYYLGVLGMPGMTAYIGMLDIGQPKEGETVVVSAAAGAVGSVAGQIAKIKGCRVIGSAGSDDKCRLVTDQFGFDACINYKREPLLRALMRACPSGIDVYFDNVGGEMLETVLRLINLNARIPLIGLISQYNATEKVCGPNLMPILVNRATIKGMIVRDHYERYDEFLQQMKAWLTEGRMKYHETVVEGLQNVPRAFIGLFHGQNIGKLVVKIAD